MRSRWMVLLSVAALFAPGCEGDSMFACGDGHQVSAAALCNQSYECANRTDEASCRYNGTADLNPIRSWSFDAQAAMQSAIDGNLNADAQRIQAALMQELSPSELDHLGAFDWSAATPEAILADPAFGHAFRAIILYYEREGAGSSSEGLSAENRVGASRGGLSAGDVGAARAALNGDCAGATAQAQSGVQAGINLVSGTVLAGTGAFALSAAVCVASVVCGVIAATAVVAGVVTAIGGVSGAAIEKLALGTACASEDGICGSCRDGECTCPSFCERPPGCGPTGTDAGPSGTDAGPPGTDAGPGGTDAGPAGSGLCGNGVIDAHESSDDGTTCVCSGGAIIHGAAGTSVPPECRTGGDCGDGVLNWCERSDSGGDCVCEADWFCMRADLNGIPPFCSNAG